MIKTWENSIEEILDIIGKEKIMDYFEFYTENEVNEISKKEYKKGFDKGVITKI